MSSITKILFGAAVCAASLGAFAGDADFTLVNSTGYDIREVYISPTGRQQWGSDRMGDGILGDGKSRLFKFADKAACKQDLKIVFDDDGSSEVWSGADLCEISKITLKYNRKSGETSAIAE